MGPFEISELLATCEFANYTFNVHTDTKRMYLQATYVADDIVTGEPEEQKTREWQLSEHMTKSEIVQTAFKCCLTSMEHRTRETFKYRGKRIFGPHFDVDKLHALCAEPGAFDVRPNPTKDL